MRIVSDNIKNALRQPTTQRKGKILANGNYYEVYNVEYYADAYEDGNVIGNAIASQLDFDLPHVDKFDTFKYFDGVWTGNNYEYVDIGTFIVFDEQDEDEFNKHITAFDNLIKFNAPFEEVGKYPKTLYQELKDVCQQAGVELVNTSIPNGNFEIENNQFVNGETLKTVLKAICQISGNYGIIKEDKLVLQLTNDTDETIIKNQHEPVTWKRKTYGINQVVLQLGDVEGEYVIRQDEEDIEKNGAHKLVITNNLFAYTQDKRNALIDELFNQVHGFGYIPYEMNCEWLNYLEIGDKVTIDGIETLVLRIQGKSPEGLESMMSAPGIINSAIKYANNTNDIKNQITRTEIIVDKQNREIEAVTNSVQDLTSFLKTIEGTNEIILENTVDSNGSINKLELSGFIEKALYPGMSYPSNNVYPGKITTYIIAQENEDGTQYNETYIDLGIELLENDKLIIENNKVFVIKNNNKINTGLEVILKTFEGKTKIKVKYFDNINIACEYIEKNGFTKYFATQVDLQSQILITDEGISSKVSKAELISEINQSAEEIILKSNRLVIESDGFTLDGEGKMTATSGKIGGYNLAPDKFSTTIKRNLGFSLQTAEEFSAILEKINAHINGTAILTPEELELYDLNFDGSVDKQDLLIIQSIYFGYLKIKGIFEINSADATKTLNFIAEDGTEAGYIGLNGLKFYNITGTNASITNELTTKNLTVKGEFNNLSDKRTKHSIKELDNKYLNIIKELNPVSFIYKYNNTKHIGFIAQDMEKVFINNEIEAIPVKIDEAGMYSINYIDLIGILWKDNQYLHKEIDILKEMIK